MDTLDSDSGRGSSLRISGFNVSDSQVDDRSQDQTETAMADKDAFMVQAVRLTGDNYEQWSLIIENVLKSHGLWPYVMGKITKPAEDYSTSTLTDKWTAWQSKDSKALAIILTTLDPVTLAQVRHCATSEDMMALIKKIKRPDSADIMTSALTDFFNASWTEDMGLPVISVATVTDRWKDN